jgi:hypothetical protein
METGLIFIFHRRSFICHYYSAPGVQHFTPEYSLDKWKQDFESIRRKSRGWGQVEAEIIRDVSHTLQPFAFPAGTFKIATFARNLRNVNREISKNVVNNSTSRQKIYSWISDLRCASGGRSFYFFFRGSGDGFVSSQSGVFALSGLITKVNRREIPPCLREIMELVIFHGGWIKRGICFRTTLHSLYLLSGIFCLQNRISTRFSACVCNLMSGCRANIKYWDIFNRVENSRGTHPLNFLSIIITSAAPESCSLISPTMKFPHLIKSFAVAPNYSGV